METADMEEHLSIRDYNTLWGHLSPLGFECRRQGIYATAESYYWPSNLYNVKCVRGGHLPYGPLVDNGDGTVTDSATGLLWQQGEPYYWLDWASVLGYCEGLSLGGFADWRLPNIKELLSLVDDAGYDPAVDMTFFPSLEHSYLFSNYWTSTNTLYKAAVSSVYDEAYTVSFHSGDIGRGHDYLDWNNPFRCVRGGNTAFPSTITGTVTDSSTGLPLSDVSMTAIDSEKPQSTITDSSGKYAISNVTVGTYTATFIKSGYITQTINSTISSGQVLTLNVQLSPIPPLTITITSPQNGNVFNSSPIIVTGNVTNNASVTVNGIQATVINNSFSASVPLSEGQNNITATASDQYGQTASHSITITYIIPTPPVISNITVSGITTDSAVISWTTDQPSDSLVEYGETTAYR
jgi:hypothetical protein